MKLFREGNLRDSNLQTGNVLVVELHDQDAEDLSSTDHYTMRRFSAFPHTFYEGGMGWQPEDKVHFEVQPALPDTALPVEVSLDPGGDLYFTLWDGAALQAVGFDERFAATEPFVAADPSQQLARVGIDTIRFFGLNMVARALETSSQTSLF